MPQPETRVCLYCKNPFAANKYSPRQKVCGSPACQKARQLESMRLWRQRNPNYFKYDESKGPQWLETQRTRSKAWREKNPEKVRAYRQKNIEQYRAYMREYMRKRRQQLKDQAGQQPPAPAP